MDKIIFNPVVSSTTQLEKPGKDDKIVLSAGSGDFESNGYLYFILYIKGTNEY